MLENALPTFLIDMLNTQYGKDIANKIIEGYSVKRKVSFRVNTIKAQSSVVEEKLEGYGIKISKVPWSNLAYIVENGSKKDLEETDMYKNGEIYLQSLSSMLPSIILEPKENTDILDMAAAPGGKTTQIAAITNNNAHITATEINKIRFDRLKYNLNKQGVTSAFVMQKDACNIDDFFSFDQILLDAPCSGSGTLNVYDKSVDCFTEKLISNSVKTQIALLKKALKILKPGHDMVYSTCSILSLENEDVLSKVLNPLQCRVVPIEFKYKDVPYLPTKINGTICVCPNDLYEGFFIAKIRKEK